MIAYKGDSNLKTKFVAEVEKHRKMDAIEQGTYGRQNGNWKGCAVACSLRSLAIMEGEELHDRYDEHADYETKLGIPEWLARLEDTLFEGLPKEEAKKWPGQFAKAINVGANLEPVKWKFGAYLMKENIDRVMTLKISDELKSQVVDALQKVMSVHMEAIRTGTWDESAARAAARAAESAAWAAARAAAWAARAAESAAWAARAAAESAWAARAAAESAAAWAAESAARAARAAAWAAWAARAARAAYTKHSKELLKILKECK